MVCDVHTPLQLVLEEERKSVTQVLHLHDALSGTTWEILRLSPILTLLISTIGTPPGRSPLGCLVSSRTVSTSRGFAPKPGTLIPISHILLLPEAAEKWEGLMN